MEIASKFHRRTCNHTSNGHTWNHNISTGQMEVDGLCLTANVRSTRTAYAKIRFDINFNDMSCGLRDRHAKFVQIAEITLYSGGMKLAGGVATSLGGRSPSGEGVDKLTDGSTGTKWCVQRLNFIVPRWSAYTR